MSENVKVDWVAKNREDAQALAEQFTKTVNNMNFDQKAFVETIMREHRTLQQNVFEAFLHLCGAWAKLDENQYDARNEYTVLTAKKIMELTAGCVRTPYI